MTPEQPESDEEKTAADCPFFPGDIVSGVVSANQGTVDGVIMIDLTHATETPPSTWKPEGTKKKKKKQKKPATVRGVLPIRHLGDHASVCGEALAAALTPGKEIEQLLVLDVDRKGVPTVSLKPLLLSAASAAATATAVGNGNGRSEDGKQAFVPKGSSEISPGDLVAGFVSGVESFGVFVKFLGSFSALCPRSMAADRAVEDPTGMFTEGDSVR